MNKLLSSLCVILVILLVILNGIIGTFIPLKYLTYWYVACFPLGYLYAHIGFKLYALGEKDDE